MLSAPDPDGPPEPVDPAAGVRPWIRFCGETFVPRVPVGSPPGVEMLVLIGEQGRLIHGPPGRTVLPVPAPSGTRCSSRGCV
jgi:hypothetical protein